MTSLLAQLKKIPLQLKLFAEKNYISKKTHLSFRTRHTPPPIQEKKRTPKPTSDKVLKEIWNSLVTEFFPNADHLKEYTIVWSKRKQIRTLASCNIDRRKVVVAKELKPEQYHKWLSPLIYHEMCHAYLEYSIHNKNGRTPWHGKEFRTLESRHPLIESFNTWVNTGGWAKAVRSNRAIEAHAKRKSHKIREKKVSFG